MNGNSSKKKLIVAATLVGVVLLAAVISVVAVLAATQQNVTSQISVTYSVSDVSATVGARYAVKDYYEGLNGDAAQLGTAPVSAGQIEFTASEGTTTKSIDAITPASLTSTYDYVTFEYSFRNDSTLGFSVTCTQIPTASNMTLEYCVVTTAVADDAWHTDGSFTWTEFDAAEDITATVAGDAIPTDTTYVTTYIYIRATVANHNSAASLSGNFGWNLEANA